MKYPSRFTYKGCMKNKFEEKNLAKRSEIDPDFLLHDIHNMDISFRYSCHIWNVRNRIKFCNILYVSI